MYLILVRVNLFCPKHLHVPDSVNNFLDTSPRFFPLWFRQSTETGKDTTDTPQDISIADSDSDTSSGAMVLYAPPLVDRIKCCAVISTVTESWMKIGSQCGHRPRKLGSAVRSRAAGVASQVKRQAVPARLRRPLVIKTKQRVVSLHLSLSIARIQCPVGVISIVLCPMLHPILQVLLTRHPRTRAPTPLSHRHLLANLLMIHLPLMLLLHRVRQVKTRLPRNAIAIILSIW
jgi:hypothetical protein